MNPWDRNAQRRHEQISAGKDLTYQHVLVPAIFAKLPPPSPDRQALLDAGCGSGTLAERLCRSDWRVTAIDESEEMLAIAREVNVCSRGPQYIQSSFDEFPAKAAGARFDVVVANMSLAGIPDVGPSLAAFRKVMRRGARLIVTDVHPWFWRLYKRHTDIPYCATTTLVEPFTISLDPTPLPEPTPVAYRPLSKMIEGFGQAGFVIRGISEPMPSKGVEELYPHPWEFPRFVVVEAHTK